VPIIVFDDSEVPVMVKLFEIAKEITNPYSLLALTYLILFLIFKGVLRKTGVQKGKSGFKIIRYLMTLVAVISVLTLFAVFGLKAYEVYMNTEFTLKKMTDHTEETVNKAVSQLKDSDLQVDYHVGQYTGANILIGNRGQGIIIISELTLHWDYRKCPEYREPLVGAPLVTYSYEVHLTKSSDSKVLDYREFKYGPGDVDKFLVDLNFPGHGVYNIWITFKYKKIGEPTLHLFESTHDEREVCVKWR
jgi:hypothetical protein